MRLPKVNPSAPAILWPKVQNPSTSMFLFVFELRCEKDENIYKKGGL